MPMNSDCIEIIDVDGNGSISVDAILTTMERDIVPLAHGEDFTGRPVTTVIASDDYVIKLRKEYKVDRINSIGFCERAIIKEQQIEFYHPDKTWFIFFDNDVPVIGNITPKLRVLHDPQLYESLAKQDYVRVLHSVFHRYLVIGAEHDKQLDLGLSNFGIDRDQGVYYVDDDIYDWDNFLSLSQFLGVFVRSQKWLTEADAYQLGELLRRNIIEHFKDPHWCTVISQHLKSVFIPDSIKSIHKSLVDGLHEGNQFSYKPQAKGQVIALLADVHGNAPSLEAVLDFLSTKNIEHGLMLGDVVGYGPHPKQCIDMLKGLDWLSTVRGNHDHVIAHNVIGENMNKTARWSLDWTLEQLSQEDRAWLGELPPYVEDADWLAVHGSPRDKSFFNAYVYQLTYADNLDEIQGRDIRWCFHGHTHIPNVYYRSSQGDKSSNAPKQDMKDYRHALICPGSIGQPRNQQVGAQIALVDLDNGEIEFHRISYDLRSVVNDMQRFDFPSQLVSRLLKGQ